VQAEMFTNPSDGIVDLAIFVRAKIENIYFIVRFVDDREDRVDAILHVQIRLFLMAVAQHVEMFRRIDTNRKM
jgi:hypothetical protein